MGCRRIVGVEDRPVTMARLGVGLSRVCIVHFIGRSTSVACVDFARRYGSCRGVSSRGTRQSHPLRLASS